MELNLDRLNGLRFADFQEKQPSTTPTEPLLEGEEYKTSAEQENALKRQIEGYKSPRKPSSTPQSTNNQSRGETRLKAGFSFYIRIEIWKNCLVRKSRGRHSIDQLHTERASGGLQTEKNMLIYENRT